MNKRIEELALEAGPTTIGEINTNLGSVHVINIEKFAELIVRECAEYAEHELDMAGYKKKFMLKHFGVEE